MYCGVPAITLEQVKLASSTVRAKPKSVINTRSIPFSSRMLAGLTSRCTKPWACAAANPAAVCMPIRRISRTGNGPRRSNRCCNERPGTYCITIYGKSCWALTAWIGTMCSCTTAAAACDSRANRRRAAAAVARIRGQNLDGNQAIQRPIERLQHDPCSAADRRLPRFHRRRFDRGFADRRSGRGSRARFVTQPRRRRRSHVRRPMAE